MTTESNSSSNGTEVTQQPSQAWQRAVFLRVSRGKPGVRRKAKAVQVAREDKAKEAYDNGGVATDADPRMVSVSKKVLDCPEYDAICHLDGEVRRYLDERQLRTTIAGAGIYPIAIAELDEVYAWLEEKKQQRQALITAFLAVYEDRCAESDAKLGTLANAADHPPKDKVAAAFYFDWLPLSFDVPDALRHLRSGLYERERARITAQLQDAAKEVEDGLAVAMHEMVQGLTRALEPTDASGKKKKFYGARLERVTTFLRQFSSRNVTNSEELANLAQQAQQLLDGVDTEMIRDNDDLRGALREEFATLTQQLAGMARTDAPRRAINLEEEADDAAASA
jgi:hypothetical protein